MRDGQVALRELLVSGADPAELLQPADAPLDRVPPPVRRLVEHVRPAELGPPVVGPLAARDHALDAPPPQVVAGLREVVPLVARQPRRPGPRAAPGPGHRDG